MRIYSGFNLEKKVQHRKAQTGSINNIWTGKSGNNTHRKSQFDKPKHRTNTNTNSNEKLLRFLSFCTFLCIAGLGSQTLLSQPNFRANASGLDDVRIFTVYRANPDNIQSESTNFELIELPPSPTLESSSLPTNAISPATNQTSSTTTQPQPTTPTTYKIKSGDNLSSISYNNKVDINLLKQWNNITDPRSLKIGQEIIISQP
jgi:LysM repeat protein